MSAGVTLPIALVVEILLCAHWKSRIGVCYPQVKSQLTRIYPAEYEQSILAGKL